MRHAVIAVPIRFVSTIFSQIISPNIFPRTDLEYLGVEDRGQQDTLLSALSLLQEAAARGGQERSKDRPVSRMDSGYYDGPRDSESDDLGSTRIQTIFCGTVLM